MKTSALVPVYNESSTINKIIDALLTLEFISEIIVVDDFSSDGTREKLNQYNANPKTKLIYHDRNQGKTAAINTALKHSSCDICVIQDADLEYDPMELADVLKPIYDNQADVVYGSRFLVKKASRVLYFYHYLANKGLTFICNLMTNLNMTDIETCYKAFHKDILTGYDLKSKGFGMEVELTALFAHSRLRIYEVPISYYGRTYSEGKKIGVKDGIHALWYIFYFNIYYVKKSSVRNHIKKVKDRLI